MQYKNAGGWDTGRLDRIDAGVDVDARDADGVGAFDLAIERDRHALIALLRAAGATAMSGA